MAIEKSNKNARTFAVGILFILSFLWLINPMTREALGIYLIFLGICVLVYSLKDTQKTLVGLTSRGIGVSMLYALLLSGGFFLITKLIPSFSLFYPQLPNAVGDSLKFFIIFGVAGTVEETFFRGALLGYVRSLTKKSQFKTWGAIIVVSIFFSIFHLVAYSGSIVGLSDFSQVLGAFGANISSFLSAFIAGILFGYLAIKTDSLVAPIVAHSMLNLIIYTSLAVIA